MGPVPKRWLAEADVVVVLDCLAPWWPDEHPVNAHARIAHVGPDPLFSRTPVRNFRSDLSIQGETRLAVPALIAAMAGLPRHEGRLRERRRALAEASEGTRKGMRWYAAARNGIGITKEWFSYRLGAALEGRASTVFSELGTMLGMLSREDHRSWFQEPHSGGLGWSFPAALGAQLAEPDAALRRDDGGRVLHVRQPDRLPPDRGGAGVAGAGLRSQQRGVGRGAEIGERSFIPTAGRRGRT